MSRFNKLSHSIWHCQYHIVFVPKYRYKILEHAIAKELKSRLVSISRQKGCSIVELNIQSDHVHLIVSVPPKISISSYVGIIKGKTAIWLFNTFKKLKQEKYWGNHFWAKGYCVDTIGLNMDMIRKYVKYQDEKDRMIDQGNSLF